MMDIFLHIASFLPSIRDVYALAQTNKCIYHYLMERYFWQQNVTDQILDKLDQNKVLRLTILHSFIPKLEQLRELTCCNTLVTEIPFLPHLIKLNCARTNITTLPLLPQLRYLYCYETDIMEIPNMSMLIELGCGYTNISKIPSTLLHLRVLSCSFTKVEVIPSTLTALRELICAYTNITFIPSFPHLEHLYCNKNIQITNHEKIKYIYIADIDMKG